MFLVVTWWRRRVSEEQRHVGAQPARRASEVRKRSESYSGRSQEMDTTRLTDRQHSVRCSLVRPRNQGAGLGALERFDSQSVHDSTDQRVDESTKILKAVFCGSMKPVATTSSSSIRHECDEGQVPPTVHKHRLWEKTPDAPDILHLVYACSDVPCDERRSKKLQSVVAGSTALDTSSTRNGAQPGVCSGASTNLLEHCHACS